MQSRRFGVAWTVHQTLPHYALGNLPRVIGESSDENDSRRAALAVAEAALAHVMPCRFCRSSYAGFRVICDAQRCFVESWRSATPRAPSKNAIERAERYYFAVHNLVNAKLEKPLVDPQHRAQVYKRANNGHEFRCALLEWLAMLAMNYRTVAPRTKASKAALHTVAKALGQNNQMRTLWRDAVRSGRDIDSLVNEWLRTEIGAQDKTDYARLWNLIYVDALTRALTGAATPIRAKRCALALRTAYGLSSDAANADALLSSEAMLRAVHDVKRQCVAPGEECESLGEFFERIESYRAGHCHAGQCK